MRNINRYSPSIFVIKQALDRQQCEQLISVSESIGYNEAPVTTPDGPVMRKELRNNNRVILDSTTIAHQLWQQVSGHMPTKWKNRALVGINERLRFYRYEPNEYFDWHYDGYFQRDNGERSQFTLIFYLNDQFDGGTTDFKDISIRPTIGDALCFWHHQLHRGATITRGRKYVVRSDIMYGPKQPR